MYYQINNVRLFVRDEGNGNPVLIFLHFWGGSSATWKSVTDILKDKYRCISYDHRGWGESEKPGYGYSIESLAKDTLELIRQMKVKNYILVGHSMGGKIAQYIAAQQPEGLQRLILVAPSPSTPTIMPKEMQEGMRNAYTSIEAINATIDHVFNAGDLDNAVRMELTEGIQKHTEASRLGWTDIALLEDVSAGVNDIKTPTLIIAGEKDIIDSPERLQREVQAMIPNSQMTVIPNTGHLIMLQEPQKLAKLIDDFIAGAA